MDQNLKTTLPFIFSPRFKRMSRWAMVTLAFLTPVLVWYNYRPDLKWKTENYANYLLEEIQSKSEDEAVTLVARLEKLGDDGIEPLTLALNAKYLSVAETAEQILENRIVLWRENLESPDETAQANAATSAVLLAKALNKHVEDFGQNASQASAKLAISLLVLPLPSTTKDSDKLVSACDKVLSTAKSPSSIRQQLPSEESSYRLNIELAAKRRSLQNNDINIAQLAAMPGNSLPLLNKPKEIQNQNNWSPYPHGEIVARSERKTVPTRPIANSNTPMQPIANNHAYRGDWGEQKEQGRVIANGIPMPGPGERVSSKATNNQPALASFAKMSLLDVMKLLHSQKPGQANAAIIELRIRGLTNAELTAAKMATSAKESDRMDLVKNLPASPGISPEPWLFLLAKDKSAEVRFSALSFLATSTSRKTQAKVSGIAIRDTDPRIAALAKRIADIQKALRQ